MSSVTGMSSSHTSTFVRRVSSSGPGEEEMSEGPRGVTCRFGNQPFTFVLSAFVNNERRGIGWLRLTACLSDWTIFQACPLMTASCLC